MAKKTVPAKSPAFKAEPLSDRVVVQPMPGGDKISAGGIIIPDTGAKEKPEKGTVVAVGPGRLTDDGKRVPMSVKAGQKVMFKKPWEEPVKLDGEEYYVLSESDITLILK